MSRQPTSSPASTLPEAGTDLAPVTVFRIEPMTQNDVIEVGRVERRCFSQPWPLSAYRRELRNLSQNCYIVLRCYPQPDHPRGMRRGEAIRSLARISLSALPWRHGVPPTVPHIAGFAGMWVVHDEAHITTIGVDPLYRGRGFGELQLAWLFDEAIRRGATWMTLEVRVSNTLAQRLYKKYGLSIQATRPGYYSDNNEDAYVMWSRSLRDPAYLAELAEHKAALLERLGESFEDDATMTAPTLEHPA